MATRTTTLVCLVSTNAQFQAFCQFIEDTFVTTGGWVVTADTGQADLTTIVAPVGANTFPGYRIYRMNDSLQATAPLFLRIDYGAGVSSIPAIVYRLGTGSNGSGTITGVIANNTASIPIQGNASSASAFNCYGSAATNRCTLGLFAALASGHFIFAIERSKDALGNDTAEAALILATQYSNSQFCNRSIYALCNPGGPQPTPEPGLAYIITSQNPTQALGGDIGVGVISPFMGRAMQPGINMVMVNSLDVSAQSSFTVNIYGTTHTYRQLPVGARKTYSGTSLGIDDQNVRCAILYE